MGATGDREIGEAARPGLIERQLSGAQGRQGEGAVVWVEGLVEAGAVVVEAALSEGLLP